MAPPHNLTLSLPLALGLPVALFLHKAIEGQALQQLLQQRLVGAAAAGGRGPGGVTRGRGLAGCVESAGGRMRGLGLVGQEGKSRR